MKDRFGPLPLEVDALFDGLRLRWKAKRLGFERIFVKNGVMKCFFLSNAQSSFFETRFFQELMAYISSKGTLLGLTLKQNRSYLIMTAPNVKTLKEARVTLDRIYEDVAPSDIVKGQVEETA